MEAQQYKTSDITKLIAAKMEQGGYTKTVIIKETGRTLININPTIKVGKIETKQGTGYVMQFHNEKYHGMHVENLFNKIMKMANNGQILRHMVGFN